MSVRIKYTIKYHPRMVRKIANAVIITASLIGFLITFPQVFLSHEIWYIQLLAHLVGLFHFLDFLLSITSPWIILSIAIGFFLRLFRWHHGTVELYDEKLIITGTSNLSIRLQNFLELDFLDKKKTILINAKTDAVKLKFQNHQQYNDFVNLLIDQTKTFDQIKINTWA